jgi:hypothetical protein
MTLRASLITAVVGSALVLGVPAALGKGEPVSVYPDAGERAVLARELSSRLDAKVYMSDAFERASADRPAPSIGGHFLANDARYVRLADGAAITDSHDRIAPEAPTPSPVTSSGRDLEWPQIGIGFGIGMLLALVLGMAMRSTRIRPLAH